MGLYRIEFKQVTPALIPNIFSRIEALGSNPFPKQSLKLSGVEATYRLRIGDYRVVYEVDMDTRTIIIHYIRHRKEVYRRL
jgi:mRNA interferase RelE/StbE